MNGSITNPALKNTIQGMTGVDFVQTIIKNVIIVFFIIGIITSLAFILIGAIQWISAGGDKAALDGARRKITSALIGLVILLGVYVIIRFIGDFLGIDLLSLPLPFIN